MALEQPQPPPQPRPHGAGNSDDEDEDGDVCRICRMPGDADLGPLRYPCKCSGTIKYVHERCLVDWLAHSGRLPRAGGGGAGGGGGGIGIGGGIGVGGAAPRCEVCGTQYQFENLYAPGAPRVLPPHEFAAGLAARFARGARAARRVWLVACVWLLLVPWLTALAWRLSFARDPSDAPRIAAARLRPPAAVADCAVGAALSVAVMLANAALGGVREGLRVGLAALERQVAQGGGGGGAAAPAGRARARRRHAGEQQQQHEQQQQDEQQQDEQQPQQPRQQIDGGDADGAAAGNGAGNGAGGAAPFHDVPFEELAGLAGPWVHFLETIALVRPGHSQPILGAC